MYSCLNIEMISSICDDKLWVSINHEEDGQQASRPGQTVTLPWLDLLRELVSAGRDRGSGQARPAEL